MDHLLGLLDVTVDIATPFLVVDGAIVTSNIEQMQDFCTRAGVALRPHIKTHKSSRVARMQLSAGAAGATVATLSEAIRLGEGGIATDVFLSTPVFYDRPKSALLDQAVRLHPAVSVAVDSHEVIGSLAGAPETVTVMVELDSGMDRTGVDPEMAVELAEASGHRFRGFFTHGGHGYAPAGADRAGTDEVEVLASAAAQHGGEMILSAGSTPTVRFSGRSPVTEERPGTYVYGDRQQLVLGAVEPSQLAAAVVTTVIHSADGKIVLDAGAKVLTKDRAPFLDGHGLVLGGSEILIDRLNDQHGMARMISGPRPPVGQRLIVVPNHICPVVNLFDEVVVVRDGKPVSSPVDLRGLPA